MREHIIVKLRKPVQQHLSSWQSFINDKTNASYVLQQDVDSILQKNEIPVWVTQEYEKAKGGNWTESEIKNGLNRIYRLILTNRKKVPQQIIDDIQLLPNVEYAHKTIVTSTEIPDYHSQSSVSDYFPSRNIQQIIKNAHRFTKGDQRIKIAVLDTGVALRHPELQHSLDTGRDFVNIINGQNTFVGDYLGYDNIPEDEVGHGTHVTGIISARGIKMTQGLAPHCRIVPIRVLGAMKRGGSVVGAGIVENINAGIKYAIDQKVDIINMSLGIKNAGGGLPHKEVIEYAADQGITIVAAAGNDGKQELYYPGANPYVIAIGALGMEGKVAPYSTYGSHISFVAPGTNIYSTYLKNNYAYSSGTSQAAPFVTALIALMKAYALKYKKRLSDKAIKKILMLTADRESKRLKEIKTGFGAINVVDALKLLDYKLN